MESAVSLQRTMILPSSPVSMSPIQFAATESDVRTLPNFLAGLPKNFQPFCLIRFHGSITRDEREIVLDCLPDKHPVKGVATLSQKRKMMKGRSYHGG